jgi:hypothetical protein
MRPYPSISKQLKLLKPGQSTIVFSGRASTLATEFLRLKPREFQQRKQIVVDPIEATARKAWLVTRTS